MIPKEKIQTNFEKNNSRISSLQQQIECEKKAFECQEKMLDSKLTEKDFLALTKFIQREHYADVVVERSIGNLCGYPLCGREIGEKLHKGRYHISLLSKTVYDSQLLNCFCSKTCFIASSYLEAQLPQSAAWLRPFETFEIKFMDILNREKQADENSFCVIEKMEKMEKKSVEENFENEAKKFESDSDEEFSTHAKSDENSD
eukprot:Sdes_comp19279_c0_seq1m10292